MYVASESAEADVHTTKDKAAEAERLNSPEKAPTPEDGDETHYATKENTPVQRRAASRAPSSAGSAIGRHVIPASANKIQRRGTNIGGAGGAGGTTPSVKNFDNSIMSNFKFRPRKPSILHLDDDANLDLDLSSDLDSDVFLDSASIDIGEPEAGDEGTPLRTTREKERRISLSEQKQTGEEEVQVKGTQQDDEYTKERSSSPLSSPPPDGAEVVLSSPLKLTEENLNRLETVSSRANEDDDDGEVSDDQTPARPPPPQAEDLHESMLPPASSSPIQSPLKSSDIESKSEEEQGDGTEKENVPAQSTRKTSKSKQQRKALADHLSTAHLRERLLPQRKRRKLLRERAARKNTFDVVSDEEEDDRVNEDEDELSYMATTKKTKANGRRRNATTRNTSTQAKDKENAKTVDSGTTAKKTRRKTYGKPRPEEAPVAEETGSVVPDQDEADDHNEDEQTHEQATNSTNDELAKQKRKFEEIWKWNMEFEDVPENEI
ncbi:hypothetical protein KEM56_000155 [Ascosphaera pollenicola]|nr:hypothetical protein KEM56_000155 [Ascosphaera pollenicola]